MLRHIVPFFIEKEPVDNPGTLTVTAQRISGRNPYQTNVTVVDPDGIRGITSAIYTSAVDGAVSDRTTQLTRVDANTFSTGNRALRNARWQRGSVTVTYVDGTTNQTHRLTATWNIV